MQGVVALVPSNVVYPSTDGSAPAWTLHGRPVPHVRAIDVGDADPVRTPGAVIRVERIKGPVLTASSGQDELWPSYLLPYLPTSGSGRTGGTAAANEAAKAILWPRILAIMRGLQR